MDEWQPIETLPERCEGFPRGVEYIWLYRSRQREVVFKSALSRGIVEQLGGYTHWQPVLPPEPPKG